MIQKMKILATGANGFIGKALCSGLASGKPIYCVMKGEVADLVTNNKIGFVAQPDDINNIRSGFEKFLDTPKHELQAFGSNMKTLLSNEFDRNKIIQQMTEEIFPLPISA